VPEAF